MDHRKNQSRQRQDQPNRRKIKTNGIEAYADWGYYRAKRQSCDRPHVITSQPSRRAVGEDRYAYEQKQKRRHQQPSIQLLCHPFWRAAEIAVNFR
jgi:hypothetical protein